jgi:RHS repeat-associated protein
VTKRYFAEGMQRLGAVFVNGQWVTQMIPYYFTRDHLGSVREVTNATGTLSTRYDYDPFGKPTWLITGTDSDFGFTGHFRHRVSGLYLPLYRAYDPIHGRWISRDPIGEDGGLNLYGYVANNPLNTVDPLGLESEARFYIYCKCRCEDEWRLVRVEVVPGLGGAVTYGPATIHVNPTDAADAVRQQANNPYTRQNPATVPNSSGGIQTLAHECGHTCQAKVLGPLYLPAAGLNSLLEILTGGYRNGLNNLKTPTERGASNTGMFGGFAPAPVSP